MGVRRKFIPSFDKLSGWIWDIWLLNTKTETLSELWIILHQYEHRIVRVQIWVLNLQGRCKGQGKIKRTMKKMMNSACWHPKIFSQPEADTWHRRQWDHGKKVERCSMQKWLWEDMWHSLTQAVNKIQRNGWKTRGSIMFWGAKHLNSNMRSEEQGWQLREETYKMSN